MIGTASERTKRLREQVVFGGDNWVYVLRSPLAVGDGEVLREPDDTWSSGGGRYVSGWLSRLSDEELEDVVSRVSIVGAACVIRARIRQHGGSH